MLITITIICCECWTFLWSTNPDSFPGQFM